jgi:DNA (cytosine-5)-methyltransferase 3A
LFNAREEGMKVLSCFDGMSCGQVALSRALIPVEKYYASEIDKYAINITMKNHPNTIQLGDITKWQSWNLGPIDMIIGGSPCQGFSFAGKGLNFKDPRSALFFTFIDILKHYKPKYFLLENVVMAKQHIDVISGILGEMYPHLITQTEMFRPGRLEPICINAALVLAQNRNRLFWTNIKGITQPKDKGIMLKDIIETGITEKDKSYCVDANYFKGGSEKNYKEKKRRQLINTQSEKRLMVCENKSQTILSTIYKENVKSMIKRGKMGLVVSEKAKIKLANMNLNLDKASCITTAIGRGGSSNEFLENVKKKLIIVHNLQPRTGKGPGGKGPLQKEGIKSYCVDTANSQAIEGPEITWRKLTVKEVERLFTLPDGYTEGVSNTQRYKMLGNGWVVDVISHIFSFIK